MYEEITRRVLRELADVELPPMPAPDPDAPRIDAARYVGTYSSGVADTVVSQDAEGRIWAERTPKGIFAQLGGPPERIELVAAREGALIAVERRHGMHQVHSFVGDDGDGHALFLHTGRADRRVAP